MAKHAKKLEIAVKMGNPARKKKSVKVKKAGKKRGRAKIKTAVATMAVGEKAENKRCRRRWQMSVLGVFPAVLSGGVGDFSKVRF